MFTLPKIEPVSDFAGEVKMFKIDMDPALSCLGQEQQYDVFASFRAGDMMELPSLIFVETRFISKQRAEAELAQQRLNPGREATISTLNFEPDWQAQPSITPFQNQMTEVLPVHNPSPMINRRIHVLSTPSFPIIGNQKQDVSPLKPVTIKQIAPLPKPVPRKTFAHATVMAGVVGKEFGTMTDSANPSRDRGMQVKSYKTNSIAIQCCINDDLDFAALEDGSKSDKNDNQQDKNEFMTLLLYNCEKSLCHSNGKVECRVCGEVQSSLKKMESHLVLHFGPRVLCFRCGIQFENKFDLRRHACAGKRSYRPSRIRCPYYNCNVVTISTLELYDHINEHIFEHSYKCAACGRIYFTVGELRLHLKFSKKCHKVKQPQLLPYKKRNLQSARDRAYRTRVKIAYAFKGVKLMRISPLTRKSLFKHKCQLCLKVLSSKFKLKNHQRNCFLQYNARYKRQYLKARAETIDYRDSSI